MYTYIYIDRFPLIIHDSFHYCWLVRSHSVQKVNIKVNVTGQQLVSEQHVWFLLFSKVTKTSADKHRFVF